MLRALKSLLSRGFTQVAGELRQTRPSERAVGDCLALLLRRARYAACARFNPWDVCGAGRRLRPPEVLRRYRHALQPDIDLLAKDRDGALWGHELKLIRWNEDVDWRVVPSSRLYDGLGQTLAVATMGVDYACLWHIFVIPMRALRMAEAKSEARAQRFDDDRIESAAAYAGVMRGVIARFELPLGYVSLALAVEGAEWSAKFLRWNSPRKIPPSPTAARIRPLLLSALEGTVPRRLNR